MDAFYGFVRVTRRKSEELGVVSVEMGAFTSQFSTTSWEKFFIGPPLLAESRSVYIRFFQNSRATFASSPFSYRGKNHSVRLRGVDPKIHRKRPKKEQFKKLVRVDENVGSVAFSCLLLLPRTCDGSYTPYR